MKQLIIVRLCYIRHYISPKIIFRMWRPTSYPVATALLHVVNHRIGLPDEAIAQLLRNVKRILVLGSRVNLWLSLKCM